MEMYVVGSRSDDYIGSSIPIFSHKKLLSQLQYKLDESFTKNQAEKLSTLKALERNSTCKNSSNLHRQQSY